MLDAIRDFFASTFTNPYIATLLISILPIVELKGGILFGYLYFGKIGQTGLGLFAAAAMGYIGSTLVAPIILLLLIPILNWLKKTKLFKKPATWMETRFSNKAEKLKNKAIEKAKAKHGITGEMSDEEKEMIRKKIDKRIAWAKFWGIFTFVAIPLPLTGVWTGSAIAAFLKMDIKRALPAIMLGNLVAAIIISILAGTVGLAL